MKRIACLAEVIEVVDIAYYVGIAQGVGVGHHARCVVAFGNTKHSNAYDYPPYGCQTDENGIPVEELEGFEEYDPEVLENKSEKPFY
jgi:hypothetical protein